VGPFKEQKSVKTLAPSEEGLDPEPLPGGLGK
jgi:hypothetical protein